MKLLCSLLAILILAFSCIPCSDAEAAVMQQHTQIEGSGSSAKDEARSATHEHDEDLCSPFCQCSCCAIAYTLPIPVLQAVQVQSLFADKAFASYVSQWPAGVAMAVWQPPRLV